MPHISKNTKDRISEQILAHLFTVAPEPQFTVDIARSLVRDEEFIKSLLHDLKEKSLVVLVKKSPQGIDYVRRQRWRLSDSVFQAYKNMSQPRKTIIDEE